MKDTIKARLEEITKKIVEKLSKGEIPWRKVYSDIKRESKDIKSNSFRAVKCNPANVDSCRPYEGINFYNLVISCSLNEYKSAWFASYLQWKKNNCIVKSGEKSTLILRFIVQEKQDQFGNIVEEEFFRWFHVFNIDQVQAANEDGEKFLSINRNVVTNTVEVIREATINLDDHGEPYFKCPLIDGLPLKIGIKFEVNNKIKDFVYDHQQDLIQMPNFRKFIDSNSYYTTLIRSIVLATGNRLGRLKDKQWNKKIQARELLVADLATTYLAEILGFSTDYDVDGPEVLKIWIDGINHDSKYFHKAISDANKAVKFIIEKAGIAKQQDEDQTQE